MTTQLVEVVFIPKDHAPCVITVPWTPAMTIGEAIHVSGILLKYPEAAELSVGIFAQRMTRHTPVQPGDRVEIYRPLLGDPMEKRRSRAKKVNSSYHSIQ